jgi:hypothetical protein
MPPIPDNPIFVSFYHPTNKQIFLSLPKNNVLPANSEIFGVHHETALTACQIIACNEPGFLSTSTNRSDINAQTSPECHRFLTSNKYYYHLVTQPGDPNYCICVDFAVWSFPMIICHCRGLEQLPLTMQDFRIPTRPISVVGSNNEI